MNAPQSLAPHDPYPIRPRHEGVIDGANVVLSWEPTPGAERYAIEIAEDAEFHRVVFAREVPSEMTSLTLDQSFPADDRTLFWRVSAGNSFGWSEGERIESFISGTPSQAGHFVEPEEKEPFGPLAALLSSWRRLRRPAP